MYRLKLNTSLLRVLVAGDVVECGRRCFADAIVVADAADADEPSRFCIIDAEVSVVIDDECRWTSNDAASPKVSSITRVVIISAFFAPYDEPNKWFHTVFNTIFFLYVLFGAFCSRLNWILFSCFTLSRVSLDFRYAKMQNQKIKEKRRLYVGWMLFYYSFFMLGIL